MPKKQRANLVGRLLSPGVVGLLVLVGLGFALPAEWAAALKAAVGGFTGASQAETADPATEEIARLRQRLVVLGDENRRLKVQLRELGGWQAAGLEPAELVLAPVVAGVDRSGLLRRVVLGRGSRHGLASGMAVLQGRALVGRLGPVGPEAATVVLLTDPHSRLRARILDSGTEGRLMGGGEAGLELRLEDPAATPVVGSEVLVSPHSIAFPGGLPIGRVATPPREAVREAHVVPVEPLVAEPAEWLWVYTRTSESWQQLAEASEE